MSSDRSRRAFLRYAPGGALLFWTASRNTDALIPPQQNPTMNQGSGNQSTSSHPSPGGAGIGPGPGPGPAQHGGDYQPQTFPPPDRKNQDPAPRKPRKNLAADQRSLRDEVLQLVRDSQELKKAVEQVGPKQPLSAEMVSKTKEIGRASCRERV